MTGTATPPRSHRVVTERVIPCGVSARDAAGVGAPAWWWMTMAALAVVYGTAAAMGAVVAAVGTRRTSGDCAGLVYTGPEPPATVWTTWIALSLTRSWVLPPTSVQQVVWPVAHHRGSAAERDRPDQGLTASRVCSQNRRYLSHLPGHAG
ncbi:hypothetical protein [Actinocatenispora comari]|nr:hypothetical protein [Actinocatenispora comari]